MDRSAAQSVSPWPHRLAVLVVGATFPLLWLGGLVTTYDAGMAVPDWPSTYGYNLFLYPWQTWLAGPWDLLIEHGHRLLAASVGLLTIALAAVLWRDEPRAWVRWLGPLAIAGVVGQGALGGMRVLWDERLLARLHGCIGPLFFALAVTVAVVTSPAWRRAARKPHARAAHLQRLAGLTTLLAYVQLVLGAHLRHQVPGGERSTFQTLVVFHLAVAAALAFQIAYLAWSVQNEARDEPLLRRPAWAALAVLVVQLGLGAATWVTNYGWPAWMQGFAFAQGYVITAGGFGQSMLTTAHVALGSLIIVLCWTVCLRSCRLLAPAAGAARAVGHWQGVLA